jgi:hypothetical protein
MKILSWNIRQGGGSRIERIQTVIALPAPPRLGDVPLEVFQRKPHIPEACISILDVSLIGLERIGISRHLVVWIMVIANRVLWGTVWHVRDSNSPSKVKTGFSVDRSHLPASSGNCAEM